jgi:deoxyribodipyrimidine photolyase
VLKAAAVQIGATYPAPIVDLAESRRAALAAYQSL